MSESIIRRTGRTTGVTIKKTSGNVTALNEQVVVVNKTSGAATTVTLPKPTSGNRFITVIDGKGDAGTNNITVNVASSGTIDGASSLVISANYGVAQFFWNGTEWNSTYRDQWTGNNVTFPGLVFESAVNGITAFAGGGQGSATQLTAMMNRVTTVATAADSVKLMAAQAGLSITVANAAAANSMNVFPSTGDAINALGANNAFAVAAGKTVTFNCMNNGQWHTILSA